MKWFLIKKGVYVMTKYAFIYQRKSLKFTGEIARRLGDGVKEGREFESIYKQRCAEGLGVG